MLLLRDILAAGEMTRVAHAVLPVRCTCPRCGWVRCDPREPGLHANADGSCTDVRGCARRVAYAASVAVCGAKPNPKASFACGKPAGHRPDDPWHEHGSILWNFD